MTSVAVGVIGHVDHGKTTLVRALTGVETDRLAEEKRRGVSIVLGFAPLRTPAGVVDLIDMPGHERFIRAMVSGATGIAAVLLVVAADEGVKPQTIEHLEIARLLGVRRGVVALTKADRVTQAEARVRSEQVQSLAREAGLLDPPAILASAVAGTGLAEIAGALRDLAASASPPRDDGIAFLPIDRAFARPGFGPVVTGTLRRGRLALGDDLELVPGGRPARVRSLQVHGENQRLAEAGRRVAVSLRGVELAQARRGMALATPGVLVESQWIDVMLECGRSASRPLANGERPRLLIGTSERLALLRLLDRSALEPGLSAPAQMRLNEPLAVLAREPFILRSDSPSETLGGGRVLDPASRRRRRFEPAVLANLADLASDEPILTLRSRLAEAGPRGADLQDLARLVGIAPERVRRRLVDIGARASTHGRVLAAEAWSELREKALDAVAQHHGSRPHEPGLPLSALARALRLEACGEVVEWLARELAQDGDLVQTGGLYRAPGFDLAKQGDPTTRRIEDILRRAGLRPPDEADILRADQAAANALAYLVSAGRLIRTVDRVQNRAIFFHRDAIKQARQILADRLGASGGFSAGEAGAALGVSRKFSIPLLEHLDSIRFTRRRGDRRVILRQEAADVGLAAAPEVDRD